MDASGSHAGTVAPTGGESLPSLPAGALAELLDLLKGVDSVELKFSVPDAHRRSAVRELGLDPLDAQIRQVVFFDTPGLDLDRHGVVVRARRIQGRTGDTVVKLRPVLPGNISEELRDKRGVTVEVDAMPGGFVCSASMKGKADNQRTNEVMGGARRVRKLFTKEQRAFYSDHAPGGLPMDGLAMLGPINVLKLKFAPSGFSRRLVAELWFYPDGSRILELSTKCLPGEAFTAAAETKAFLTGHGLDLSASQQTKTRTALEFFAAEVAAGNALSEV